MALRMRVTSLITAECTGRPAPSQTEYHPCAARGSDSRSDTVAPRGWAAAGWLGAGGRGGRIHPGRSAGAVFHAAGGGVKYGWAPQPAVRRALTSRPFPHFRHFLRTGGDGAG